MNPIKPAGRNLARSLVFLVCIAAAPAPSISTEYRIVVHPDNATHHLSASEISSLFLKKTEAWADGEAVEPVDLSADSAVRSAFSLDVHGRTASNIRSYWQQVIFSGKGVPPPEMTDDEEVVAFVRSHRGAIGYVSAEAALDGVKVLNVVLPPERVRYVSPVYPEMAKRARKEGIVLLDVVIDRDGSVANVVPVTELGMGLTREAVRAVKQWRFQPPTMNGEATSATFRLSVSFELP